MKQLLIRLSSLYSSQKRNELAGYSKLTTQPDTIPFDKTNKPTAEEKTLTKQQDTHKVTQQPDTISFDERNKSTMEEKTLTKQQDTLPFDKTNKATVEEKTPTKQQDTHPADGMQTTTAEPKMPTTTPAIDQPATTCNFIFSPKQIEVATQLVSLHCLPAAESDTGDCVAISGKTPKDAVLEAMKKQFYNVYG
jgi:hypothetical protein